MAKLPNGVLFYGPLRTRKSTLVYAMAREARVPFFHVLASDIAYGGVKIRSLFNEARRCLSSIVFVNHIDLIASIERNCESYSALIQLHTEMDKCNKDGEMVVVIAATDKPETLNPAFMNSSRFYNTYHVTKPDQDCRHKKAGFYFKDHIKEEDEEGICNLVASQTLGLGWAPLKDIVIESTMAAEDRRADYVIIGDVPKAIRGFDEYIKVMKIVYQGYEDVRVM
nr:ATPase, AAA-type, core, P-loop containing nucleoside triphosphate hydrolase [Tanacetum cinerariifolium]